MVYFEISPGKGTDGTLVVSILVLMDGVLRDPQKIF